MNKALLGHPDPGYVKVTLHDIGTYVVDVGQALKFGLFTITAYPRLTVLSAKPRCEDLVEPLLRGLHLRLE